MLRATWSTTVTDVRVRQLRLLTLERWLSTGRTTVVETGPSQLPPDPWAPARGEQGGQAPTLEKINVGMAHPGNFSRG